MINRRIGRNHKIACRAMFGRATSRATVGVAISYPSLSPQEVVAYSCNLVWKQFTHVQRRDSSGKLVPTLRRCISATDDIKINEQNKSIGI